MSAYLEVNWPVWKRTEGLIVFISPLKDISLLGVSGSSR